MVAGVLTDIEVAQAKGGLAVVDKANSADLSGKNAERDGQRENVEIVLRTAVDEVALADIARERGVSRQAVTKRYQRGVKYLAAFGAEALGQVAQRA